MKSFKMRIISFILCVAFTLTVWPLATFAESIENIEAVTDILYNFFKTEFQSETDEVSKNFIEEYGEIVNSYYYPTAADELEAVVASSSAVVYDGFEKSAHGIDASSICGETIWLAQYIEYANGEVLYRYYLDDKSHEFYSDSLTYSFIHESDITLVSDPEEPDDSADDTKCTVCGNDPCTCTEVTVCEICKQNPCVCDAEDNNEADEGDSETTLPEPTKTLDFISADWIADDESCDEGTTDTIKRTPVVLYKSLDNGADGIELEVEIGTEIELITKYTFTNDDTTFVFYRYDYNGENEQLAEAALSEQSGYQFIYSEYLTEEELIYIETEDTETGVSISAELPSDVVLEVTTKTLEDTGIDTSIYPIGEASLFYDVTLYQNDTEYQPENGITVTFPEDAILDSGLEVGDYYKVYHIHDGFTDITGPFQYNGGNIDATFESLSVVGVTKDENTIDLSQNIISSTTDIRGSGSVGYWASLTSSNNEVIIYDDIKASYVNVYRITDYADVVIELLNEYKLSDGTVYYQFSSNDSVLSGYSNYFISAENVSIICTCQCNTCTGIAGCSCCDNCTCGDAEDLSEDAQNAYTALLETGCLADYESYFDSLSDEVKTELAASSYWTEIQEHNYHLVYSHFYSVGTETEYNAIIAAYPEAWKYIKADEELYKYNLLHLERIRYVAANPEIELILGEERIPIIYPSYTQVAGLVPYSSSAISTASYLSDNLMKTFAFARSVTAPGLAKDDDGNGVALGKSVTYDEESDQYIVRLEAYTTGSSVTVVTEEELPADIILVLDLSGSMDSNMDNVAYAPIESGTAQHLYQTYGSENVFVLIDGEYREVTITGSGETVTNTYTYNAYSGKGNAYKVENLVEYINSGNELYYKVGNNYYLVGVKEGNYSNTYQFYYITDSGNVNFGYEIDEGEKLNSNNYRLYTKSTETTTTYDSYIFSYVDANGQTVTRTYEATASVVSEDDPTYYVLEDNGDIRKSTALVNAVQAFSKQVAAKAQGDTSTTEDDIAHHVAIVGFCGGGTSDTGIYIGSTIYQYGTEATGVYSTALQNMSTTAGVGNVNASIDILFGTPYTAGTHTYCGTKMAYGILDAYDNDKSRYVNADGETIRTKVVVIFTDGSPNGTDPYNAPIYDCYHMKQKGATVYTVGILDDGSVTPIPPTSILNKYMHYMSSNYQNAKSMTNPGDFTNTQYAVDGSSYYMLASNASDLNNIFSSISSSATSGGSRLSLSTTTEVRDIISPYFQLPTDASKDSISLYTSPYIGVDDWGVEELFAGDVYLRHESSCPLASCTCSSTTTTHESECPYFNTTSTCNCNPVVCVSGFDYSANWVGTETAADDSVSYHGNKLIIEFPIVVDPDFLGGSNVVTNGSASGIYENSSSSTVIENFEIPDVDIDLKEISNIVKDKHIYLSNTTDLTGILDLYVKRDDQNEDLKITVDGVNNAYVNLVYTIKLDDKTIATYTIPAEKAWTEGTWDSTSDTALLQSYLATNDTEFSVSCTMSDAGGVLNSTSTTGKAKIYVYKPTVTFQDSVQEYNKDLKLGNNKYTDITEFLNAHKVSIVWSHSTETETPEGNEPNITFEYKYTANAFKDSKMNSVVDVPVNVTATIQGTSSVSIGNNEGITYITYEHSHCEHPGCTFDANNEEFIVHVINAITSLTITKVGLDTKVHTVPQGCDRESAIIKVQKGEETPFYVVLNEGNNYTATISGLIIGDTYTITEETSWTWRYGTVSYTANGASGSTVTLVADYDAGTEVDKDNLIKNYVVITNSNHNDKWLGGDNYAVNVFDQVSEN